MTKLSDSDKQTDFSLVLGGPLFQLFRRVHLSGSALELCVRRMVIISCVAWVPLLLLSVFSGQALGGELAIPFFYDIETHARFLIALPLLIAAELIVHKRLRPIVEQFLKRQIVGSEELPKFQKAIESTLRLRNSVVGEVVLLVLVYTLGLWVWRNQIVLGTASWYAIPNDLQLNFTPAGLWLMFVSVPIFQFILLRWYLRFFLWFWFLFRVSRLNLRLIPIHPDKSAGLGFLGSSFEAFAPILVAQGVLLAGLVASQIFYAGQTLVQFKVQIIGFIGFFILVMILPLTVFTPLLSRMRRQARREFGALANRYAKEFQEKWIDNSGPKDEALLGSADIQSLADLGNSLTYVQEMRIVPFTLKDVIRIAVTAAIPFLPLTLTTFSLEQLADRLFKAIF